MVRIDANHLALGGMRASIYNALQIEGVKRLIEYLREFKAKHGWSRGSGAVAGSVVR